MASPAIPPPPGGAQTSPAVVSPDGARPSPLLEKGSDAVVRVVQGLRELATSYPTAAPVISQINDLMNQVYIEVMKGAAPGEPAAPPMVG